MHYRSDCLAMKKGEEECHQCLMCCDPRSDLRLLPCSVAADLSASVLLTKDCWNKLFVPVDTSKVAHGDANLDIRDFLATK